MTAPLELLESSSPIVTRAVAAGLRGEYAENYLFPAWQRALLLTLGHFPQGLARFAISRFQATAGFPPSVLANFALDDLIQARLDDYARSGEQFPALTVGAALGGATASLSLALGAAFLPQTFVITLQKGSFSGDTTEYLERTRAAALRIAQNDRRLMTIQHYDPVHDGWLTRFVNHLRFKLVELPGQYARFIKKRLAPGGALVYLEGGAEWLRYRLGERSVFQVGGWGDISAQEFLEGSPRLSAYARAAGLKCARWPLETGRWPLETGPNPNGAANRDWPRRSKPFAAQRASASYASRSRTPMIFHGWPSKPPNNCSKKRATSPPESAWNVSASSTSAPRGRQVCFRSG